MNTSMFGRMLLLLTGFLAAYQVGVGIDRFGTLPIFAFTLGFGILLVAALLLIILGFDMLKSPSVVVISSIIPLSLSVGLVWQYLAPVRTGYLAFAILGLLVIAATRFLPVEGKWGMMVVALTHGVSGLVIFLLPIILSLQGQVRAGFSLVGVGGALIGSAGLLLVFLEAGRPLLSRQTVLKLLPALLLMMTICFVAGSFYG